MLIYLYLKKIKIIDVLDKDALLKLIDMAISKKKFKDFFNKNVASL
jgi:hypothetical protein